MGTWKVLLMLYGENHEKIIIIIIIERRIEAALNRIS